MSRLQDNEQRTLDDQLGEDPDYHVRRVYRLLGAIRHSAARGPRRQRDHGSAPVRDVAGALALKLDRHHLLPLPTVSATREGVFERHKITGHKHTLL